MKNFPIKINGIKFDEMNVAENYLEMVAEHPEFAANGGMIYVFPEECQADFFNGCGTQSIDSVAVNAAGIIVDIFVLSCVPQKDNEAIEEYHKRCMSHTPLAPYQYVFEFAGGTLDRLGLNIGEKMPIDLSTLNRFANAKNIKSAFCGKHFDVSDKWLPAVINQLNRIITTQDPVFDLNLQFVGAKFSIEILKANDWNVLHGIDRELNLWLEKMFLQEDNRIFCRACCSDEGFFRYFYYYILDADGSLCEKDNSMFPADIIDDIKCCFSSALLKPPMPTIAAEIENIIGETADHILPESWSSDFKKFFFWMHEFQKNAKENKFLEYRFLNGMLRFGRFCDYGTILAKTMISAVNLNHRKAMAILAYYSLTRSHESSNSFFWNATGYTLDHLDLKEGALYCFAKAWNLRFDPVYGENIWLMGELVIDEMLQTERFNELFAVVEIMACSVHEDVSWQSQVKLLCLLGMLYEKKNDISEASNYYYMAWDAFRQNQQDSNRSSAPFIAMRWEMPILYQSIKRIEMADKNERMAYLDAQLKTFPQTPLNVGYRGRIPIKYVEGGAHGDHWDTVAENFLKDPEKVFTKMIEEGVPDTQGPSIALYETGSEHFTRGTTFHYRDKQDKNSPVESYFIIGQTGKADADNIFASAFPVFKKGAGCPIVRKVDAFQVWSNALEATATINLKKDGTELSFFVPDYCGIFNKIQQNAYYYIELGAFAYHIRPFEEMNFDITGGPLYEEKKLQSPQADNVDPVRITIGEDFCNISRSFSEDQDNYEITGKICEITEFTFFGNPCLRLVIDFDERGCFMKLPVFVAKSNLEEGFVPETGDVIECTCWLQGWILHETNEEPAIPDGESPEDDEIDLEKAFLTCVRGREKYDLKEVVLGILRNRFNAENIQTLPESLPGDPDYICRINGKTMYLKVMTGYFETEDECKKAWQYFKPLLSQNSLWESIHAVSSVAIKLGDSEYYKVYYNGFDILNPEKTDGIACFDFEK